MKKIWVLRYNNGTADVFDEDQGSPSWPYVDALDAENEIKELKSDYDELRERVAWYVECEDGVVKDWLFCGTNTAIDELWESRDLARQAVEELL